MKKLYSSKAVIHHSGFWIKLFRIMRISAILLLIGVMQVFATDSYSQATTLSLAMRDATVQQVLEEIEAQSEFYILFNHQLVDVDRKVNIEVKDKKIGNILSALLKDTDTHYVVLGNQIILSPKENLGQKLSSEIPPQGETVTGVVTDQDGNPLPGANIVVKGSSVGTVTNMEGEYSITIEDSNATLLFSFVGMLTREIVVGDQRQINITLSSDVLGLEEIIVVGYGTQRKENLTGAVDVVEAEQISQKSATNLTEALQGVSPNLNVYTNGWESEAGGKMTFNIRGTGSLTGDDSPYVLVDGVPTDINLINPSDIESFTVLKDAAASAIYGARAPYGVILITTKKGSMDEKVSIEYSNNISFSNPLGMPHMSSSLNYATAHDQASINAGLAANFTDENYDRIRQYMAGDITEETWLMDDGSDWMGNGIWSIAGNGNNDWLYEFYDDMVMRQKHDISVKGGGTNNSYYFSAGLFDQPDELRYGDQYYKRYNVTGNITSKATKWLTLNLNTKFIKEDRQYFNSRQGWPRYVMYHNFFRTNSFRPKILPNGEYSNISYIPMLNGGKENQYGNNVIVSAGATIEPIENWQTVINYSYKHSAMRIDDNEETVYGTFPDESQYVIAFPISAYAETFSDEEYQILNVVSSYNKTVLDHYFNFMVGYEHEHLKYNSLWGRKTEVLTANVPSISTATGEYYLDDVKSHWATQGFFGRVNYNYKAKYLVEFNARYDGSSRFEEDSRWGFFPSFSAGYVISKENFWEPLSDVVNSLKIRASWGSLGNQNVPNYLYLSTLGIGTNLGWIMGNQRPNYTTAPGLVSSNLTWETSRTLNFGMDIAFLDRRLAATVDIYNRSTTEMFGPAEAYPIVLGTDVPLQNNASLETKGFELVFIWKDNIGKDFSYNIMATLADNVSTVTEYNNPTKTLSTWYEGSTLGEIWGLQSDGLYQSDNEAAEGPDQSLFYPRWGAGDVHYEDIDGDGVITRGDWTADNSGDYSVIGNYSPRFLHGITVGARWKGFDFNMFWQGVGKRDFAFQEYHMTFFGFQGHQWWGMNVFEKGDDTNLDYWRPNDETNLLGPNTDAYYPRPYLSKEDYKNKQPQTRYMQSAAYIRLKDLNIGYTIPPHISKKVAISNARIYISGTNLLTFTKLTKLIDPEALNGIYGTSALTSHGVGKVHPLRRVYAIGVNITF